MKRKIEICKKCSNFKKTDLKGQYLCIIDDFKSKSMDDSWDVSDVPDNCSYGFEHIVMEQNKIKLNKEICMNCINTEKKKHWQEKDCVSFSLFKWGQKEEEAWDENMVWCPFAKNVLYTKLRHRVIKNNKIPDECKYKLEHMVMSDDETE